MGDPAATAVVGAVQRHSDRYERGMRIEDSCLGLIQFENGAQATIESDLTPRETASINCNFYGTEGVHPGGRERRQADERLHERLEADLHLRVEGLVPRRVPVPGERHRRLAGWQREEYRGEAKNAYAVMEIMMALYESARLKEVTRLPLPTRANPLDLMVESGDLPILRPGKYDIRSSATSAARGCPGL